MKIPETIRIGGVDYAITERAGLNDGAQVLCGQISYPETEIRLNPDECGNAQFQGQVLWHEILHGIANHSNLELGEKEENIIDTFAKGIYQVLQDNGRKLFDIKD